MNVLTLFPTTSCVLTETYTVSSYPALPPDFDFAAAKAQRDAATHVYFVEGAGLIKIGYAVSALDRFFSMLTCSPVPLSLLASMPGGPPAFAAPLPPCRASWSDGECMLSDRKCPNPTPGDPSNCPREKANPRRLEED